MFKIGCHLSIADGYLSASKTAVTLGANTYQYFSRNPRGGSKRAVDLKDIARFNEYNKENGISVVLAHAPYVINASSADIRTRVFARQCLREDLETMQNINNGLYNFHPGSHVEQGVDKGIELICETLNSVITTDLKTTILLEAMSGKGSEIGSKFEELGRVIAGVDNNKMLGILIDTCHIYSAGYDIKNNLDGVLEELDKAVGLNRLKAIHLNDSMMPFNSKKDRHEKIGEGTLGIDTFANLINHKYLRDLPFYLETPNENDGYAREIELLKSLRNK